MNTIFVPMAQALEWRKEWMADHPVADGEDHVTPFDALLYQHVPYDQHTQRLRGAVSNIKWSEVPLAKLEAIAAVLCEYGCTCPSGDGSLRWPCPVHPPESQA